jgi:hypothetical protein
MARLLITARKSRLAMRSILLLVLAKQKQLSQKPLNFYEVTSYYHSAIGLALKLIDNTVLSPQADF